jgi:hypothetical protein
MRQITSRDTSTAGGLSVALVAIRRVRVCAHDTPAEQTHSPERAFDTPV